jgi:hypothetical protein
MACSAHWSNAAAPARAALPWLDAALSAFSLVASVWAARKRIANWTLWIVLDSLYVGVFVYKGLYPTAALYAIRPDAGYFSLSGKGTIGVDEEGRTHFRADGRGRCRYLMVSDAQRELVKKAMIELASRRPDR